MSLSNFMKLVTKAFKFTVMRPIQRFNIENRVKKYLGPDAIKFKPAPRAIGPMSGTTNIKLLNSKTNYNKKLLFSENNKKPFSESEVDDKLVIESSNKLQVNKTVSLLENSHININNNNNQITASEEEEDEEKKKNNRVLPKLTSLQMSDPACIWNVEKIPPGRLDLKQLQQIMIYNMPSKLVSEKYGVKEEYAETLIKSIKQVRVLVSPRLKKILDYTNRDNKLFQETKDFVYFVDKRLRNDIDKSTDKTFLPEDKLDPEIRDLLEYSKELEKIETPTQPKLTTFPDELLRRPKRIAKRPEPLRLEPTNMPKQLQTPMEQRQSLPLSQPPPRLSQQLPPPTTTEESLEVTPKRLKNLTQNKDE